MTLTEHDAQVRQLESRILSAMTDADGTGPNANAAFEALVRVIVFIMSMCPPESRPKIADQLERSIPAMVAEADAFAEFSERTH